MPSKRLKRWAVAQQKAKGEVATAEIDDVRYEAYQSLLESRVRIAWVCVRILSLAPSDGALTAV